ncbi:MAG: class A beta-lactamase-related serine hydrolase [Chloroflexota bacterium]|nr:class A beta-lactamase-related serine hydrolase [Chloroflexota bacterium]
MAELRRSAANLVAAFDGKPGIWLADPTQPDPIFTANPDEPFVTASLYKLALLLHVERLVQAGRLSYEDTITIEEDDVRHGGANEYPGTVMTVDEALEGMITFSDNGPALAFLRIFGPVSINASLAAQKIADFHIAASADEDNIVTPRALATYFALLAERRLVSTAASERMLARLRRQHINDRLPRKLPVGVTVAHKTGDLVGYAHDVGVIDVPGAQLVVVAMTSGASEEGAYDFIARLGSLAYSAYSPDPARLPAPAPVVALEPPQQQGANDLMLAGVFIGGFGALLLARRYARRRRVPKRAPRGPRPLGVWTPNRRSGGARRGAGAVRRQ